MKCVGRQVEHDIIESFFPPGAGSVWLERGSWIGACLKNTSVH